MTNKLEDKFNFIIIGGGIAGTTCAQRLCNIADPDIKILIISSSPMVKSATNIRSVTKFLHEFDIEEKSTETFKNLFKNLTIVQKYVSDLNSENHEVFCTDGSIYKYDKLCICTGGSPKLVSTDNEHVLGIRDTETVMNFQKKLKNARQVMIVGNGGIATELAYEIENCKVIWAIKDAHISHVYFDAHSSKFFETRINEDKSTEDDKLQAKRSKYSIMSFDMSSKDKTAYGSALGPDWANNLTMKGSGNQKSHQITIEYKCEIKRILTRDEYFKESSNKQDADDTNEWPVYVELTNNKTYGCDFIVSATGVVPAVDVFTKNNKFEIAADGGLKVNDKLETNLKDIYAAGDACTASWNFSPHWFQMRLWSQAFQMGDYAARSLWASFKNQTIQLDFCFELFAHVTKFFNFKVIMLGKYDARDLGNDYQLLIRCTPGMEYVKIAVHDKKVYGALFIGETDLEETFENLILNQIDVSPYGEDLINPDVDIEDYFD